ncbi:MAG: phenylacetate--CoA ligase, partial [Actinomycetota bacterium]|nr:phenylacetate--CoA ligase [Actinomycetota bacterium]
MDSEAEGLAPGLRWEVQQRRLRGLVDRLLAAGGVQAGRMRDCGVTAGADVSLADLHRLPTVSKRDLWDHYPHGLRAVDADEVVCV